MDREAAGRQWGKRLGSRGLSGAESPGTGTYIECQRIGWVTGHATSVLGIMGRVGDWHTLSLVRWVCWILSSGLVSLIQF